MGGRGPEGGHLLVVLCGSPRFNRCHWLTVCAAWQHVQSRLPCARRRGGWVQETSTIQPQAKVLNVRLRPVSALQHMGKFSVACVEGCSCDLLIADGHGTEKWSQLNFAMLLATPAGEGQLLCRPGRGAINLLSLCHPVSACNVCFPS